MPGPRAGRAFLAGLRLPDRLRRPFPRFDCRPGRAGAQAKVRQMEQDFPHLLASGQSRAYDTVAFAQNEVIRDLQSVIKASRALSEEINLERLIENLMTLLLERAGAQRGLLLRVSDNHIPEIEASARPAPTGCGFAS